jgi:peptide chain release factor 3
VPWVLARWPARADGAPVDLEQLQDAVEGMVVIDVRDRPVVLFDRAWALQTAERVHPEYVFAETATGVVVRAA